VPTNNPAPAGFSFLYRYKVLKIIATSDTHFAFDNMCEGMDQNDCFVHAGDAMYSGYLTEWHGVKESFKKQSVLHKYFIPGNHDIHVEVFSGPALAELRKECGVTVVGVPHTASKVVLPNGMTLGGCPYVSNLPRWAFNRDEDTIWGYLDMMGRVDVLVAHSPPRAILDRGAPSGNRGGSHYGLAALRKYIERFQPDIIICGHVHEQYGSQKVGRTMVYNVSHCNLDYQQVNPPVVIEL
jgi:Icc-related predicted phosphoesterase